MKVFSPNGIVTLETCPVCQEPEVKVEHGQECNLVQGEAKPTGIYQHLWHCPECGDSLAIVLSDCPSCVNSGSEMGGIREPGRQ